MGKDQKTKKEVIKEIQHYITCHERRALGFYHRDKFTVNLKQWKIKHLRILCNILKMKYKIHRGINKKNTLPFCGIEGRARYMSGSKCSYYKKQSGRCTYKGSCKVKGKGRIAELKEEINALKILVKTRE